METFGAKVCLVFIVLTLATSLCLAKDRIYYVAAVDVDWDYAPTGINAKNGKLLDIDEDASVFTKAASNRIGKVYKKTIYREYTDAAFSKQKPRDKSLGILGPVLKGEEGDTIVIYFKNMAKRPFSMHPHGVFYNKASEGAKYTDNTSADDKKGDAVAPGTTHKYEWFVHAENTPRDGDDMCLPWVYHSHVIPTFDINTGTVGILLTCKKSSLDSNDKRLDVDKEMFVLLNVFDENESWYLDDNLRKKNIDPKNITKEDEAFKESNLMHSMNGRFYGNLQGLDVCVGDKVAWYMAVLGNEVDMHTATFHGNTITLDKHRKDTVSLFPAKSSVSLMEVTNPGNWMFSCQVTDHFSGGMFTLYNAKQCGKSVTKPTFNGVTREYFIAAEEIEWDYGPSGRNLFGGGFLSNGSNSATFFARSSNRIGGKYIKALYTEYSDSTFSVKKNRTINELHLGLMGPVIKAEVGDKIRVVFKNKASRNFSIHPRGVLYDKRNEGALYNDNTTGSSKYDDGVAPNSNFTYEWTVPASSAGPAKLDWPCVAWMYSSNVDQIKDMYSGLVGPLVTCKKGFLQSSGIPKDFDAERFLLMAVMDENKSWYLDKNMNTYCTSSKCANISKEDAGFVESNKMHQVNGYLYGNLRNLEFCKGQKILWHAFAIGTEIDMHAIYFNENTFESSIGNHKDSVTLFPGVATSFKMVVENVGKWGLVCRVDDHFNAGMQATYIVNQCNAPNTTLSSTMKRKFYIGIVEMEWDYAESNRSLTHEYVLDKHPSSTTFTKRGAARIGKVYKKAVYREFTDSTFTKQKPRSDGMKHLGVMGPIIRAEEGDEVVVVLKNMAKRMFSINPQGAFHRKESKALNPGVAPGSTFTYHWFIPSRAAPGANDGSCVTWSYFSGTDSIKDVHTGLIGPLITCKKGTLDRNGKRKDVDREMALLFTVMDENQSWYLDENIRKYALTPSSVSKEDEGFIESNKMHAINGYIYGNGPNNGRQYEMKVHDNVVWYLMGVGNEVDIHTVHFHANNFIHRTDTAHLDDVYNVFPGVFQTVEMKPTNPGIWLLHCHVHDHLKGGMETRYIVKPASQSQGQIIGSSLFLVLGSLAFMQLFR